MNSETSQPRPNNEGNILRLTASVIGCLLVAFVWSVLAWNRSVASERTSRLQLIEAEGLANKIRQGQLQTVRISTSNLTSLEVQEAVDKSRDFAQLPVSVLRSISTGVPVQINKTNYQRQETELTLDQISLPRLRGFLRQLGKQAPQQTVTSIRLTPLSAGSTDPQAEELWRVTLVLTQVIYAPILGA